MIPVKNLPLILNLAYVGFNRGIDGGDFAPTFNDGILVTHCNQFIQYICNGLGYDGFNGKNANDMISFMNDPTSGWISPADERVVQAHANNGVIVLAGWSNIKGHGHVCLVLPGILEQSNSAGKSVPKVANVGKDVFFGKRISYAFSFPDETPTYFAMAGMI